MLRTRILLTFGRPRLVPFVVEVSLVTVLNLIFASMLPPYLQTFATIIGFESDEEKAMKELEACISSKVTKAAEASLLMAGLKLFYGKEEESGRELLRQLKNEYPYITSCFFF